VEKTTIVSMDKVDAGVTQSSFQSISWIWCLLIKRERHVSVNPVWKNIRNRIFEYKLGFSFMKIEFKEKICK
jgi:hypothetical protein